MIIVLLLFFQSLCLYCQRLVLYVHDKWINPKNARLLKEAAERTLQRRHNNIEQHRDRDQHQHQHQHQQQHQEQRAKRRRCLDAIDLRDNCRFCANTPQGYCRHHFHLQELHVQQLKQRKQSRPFWNPLNGANDSGGVREGTKFQELRQLRKINRELRRNLHQHQQQQQFYRRPHQTQPTQQTQQEQQAEATIYDADDCLPDTSSTGDLNETGSPI